MKENPNLVGYDQNDVEKLSVDGHIVPNIDEYANLNIQNVSGQLFLSSITIPLQNVVYNEIKVQTKLDPNFYEL